MTFVHRSLRLRATLVGVTAGLLFPLLVAPAASADDGVAAGDTVVGELMQAWPEYEDPDEAVARAADGPLTWIETSEGDSVRLSTEDVTGYLGDEPSALDAGDVPLGATVEVVVGKEVEDSASAEDGIEPALEVLAAEVVDPAPADSPVAAAASDVVTIVMMLPTGGVPEPSRTLAQVEAAVAGPVADFWREQTGGAVQLTVAPGNDPTWIQGSAPCADYTQLWNDAATQVQWQAGAGKHLLVYLPRNSVGCAYGLAQVGTPSNPAGKLYVTDVEPTLIAHELGHNFGLGHSSALRCHGSMEGFTSSCETTAYDDLYDVMGYSWGPIGSLSAPHAARLGVLPGGQQQVMTATGGLMSGRYTLLPAGGLTGTRALKLVVPAGRNPWMPGEAVYWLEYRTPVGQDAWLGTSANWPGLQPGLLLRRESAGQNTSLLLDGTTQNGVTDRSRQDALPLGATLSVGLNFQITVESLTPSGATVLVTGSRPALALPVANWEALSAVGSTISVGGWTYDPDSPLQSLPVQISVDGQWVSITANGSRPDVGAAFPGVGDLHGFSWSGTMGPGPHTVCVYAIDAVVASSNSPMGCRSISTQMALPVANWEVLSAAGPMVTVSGWALDPDSGTAPSPVQISVDGQWVSITADGSRPDVGAAFPGVGDRHGFSWSGTMGPGPHTVCVYAIDADLPWRNVPRGCRSIDVQLALPVANWEVLSAAGPMVTVSGWALDPDSGTAPSPVQISVDGQWVSITANGSRPDVGAAFPGVGDRHGFSWSGTMGPGPHTVCVYAIDADLPWRNVPRGCRSIDVQLALPVANWEALSAVGSTISVGGWTYDPDSPLQSLPVQISVDGQWVSITANGSRPDVGAAFPGVGDRHGFSWSGTMGPGPHTVCVYAIDADLPWRNVPLGCRSVTT